MKHATRFSHLFIAITACALLSSATFANAAGNRHLKRQQQKQQRLLAAAAAGNMHAAKMLERFGADAGAVAPAGVSLALAPAAPLAPLLFWRTDGTAGGVWSTSAFWSNPASATGGTLWASADDAEFTANSTLTFGTTSVGNVTVDAGVTVTVAAGGTLTLGGVRTFDVGTGGTLTWTTQPQSTAVGNEGAGIIKNGAGILSLGAIAANARYDGGFTLNAGTVIVSGASSFGTGVMTINGGTLQSSGGNTYTSSSVVIGGNFAFAGTGNDTWNQTVSLGAADRTITNNTTGTATRTFSNTISSTGGGLIFAGTGGSGGIVLSAANTYSGGTTISGGKLIANADGALGSGNVSITAGTVTLTLQNGATQNYIADSASLSIVTGTGTVFLNYSGTDTVGTLTINGTPEAAGQWGAIGSGAANQDAAFSGTGFLNVVAIPEPSTWMMIGVGAVLLAGVQRFRRK
jgi:autotransporter-associated beta strand protein